MAGDPYRALGPIRAVDTSYLHPRADLALGRRCAGASLALSSVWLVACEFAPDVSLEPLRYAIGCLPYLAAGLMVAASHVGLRSLQGAWAVARWSFVALALADLASLCLMQWIPSFEPLIAHYYFASALIAASLAGVSAVWRWQRRLWLWRGAALACAVFVGLFARIWLAWVMAWPMTQNQQDQAFGWIAAAIGLTGACAVLAAEPRLAHEEVWLRRAALPSREKATLVALPDGATQVHRICGGPIKFVGLADALEWLRENDYVEDDPARFASPPR